MTQLARQVVLLATLATALAVREFTGPSGRAHAEEQKDSAAKALAPADERFAAANPAEVPDLRRHVVPLLGRLGCNGRAWHGSLQGKGGFRLSLFGYDHKADHEAIVGGRRVRANVKSPDDSLLLDKPTHGDEHGGGERIKEGTWPYHLLRRWITAGALPAGTAAADKIAAGATSGKLLRLEISPPEVLFTKDEQRIALRIVAHWADDSCEDVTPLCRYQIDDEPVAKVNEDGVITSVGRGDAHVVVFYDTEVAVAPILRPVSDKSGQSYPAIATPTKIDALIAARLRKLGIVPSEICSDGEFLRRVSLDMTGTLPTPQEVATFLADSSPDKRSRKVDELLGRPTYVARWTTKLCDITGNSPRHFDGTGPMEEYARQWYDWIARRVRDNVPYDQLVAGIALGNSRLPGQDYRSFIAEQSAYFRDQEPLDFTARETLPYFWARHTVRLPEERALSFSHAFLGVRLDCAQCHKHPFDRWTQEDFKGFTAFFERVGFGVAPDARKLYQEMISKLGDKGNQNQRERARLLRAKKGEVVPWNEVFLAPYGSRVEKGRVVKAADTLAPRLLGAGPVALEESADPRAPLVDWLRRKDNPYFARVFVNRVWAEYFGVGIVNPPDDLNLANPPSNAPLLNYLAEGFIAHGFDMKWLHREIANSHAYQRSVKANDTNRLDERNFSRAVFRRLPAETLFDAIAQATAGAAELGRATTALEERAIGPKGGALVGRRGDNDHASKVFGRSPRDTNCDCSASHEPNLLQAIYLQNDKEVLDAIGRNGGWLAEVKARAAKAQGNEVILDAKALIREAYLRTLSRLPAAGEVERCAAHFERVGEPVAALRDLLSVLLSCREFITNH